MKNKFSSIAFAFLCASLSATAAVSAQVINTATMPTLYNQSGMAVNTAANSVLPAGTYYLEPNATDPVDYYGNGMYYDPSTMTYGGSVSDPYGTAGVSLGYTTSVLAPSVPNTGMGGEAAENWMVLALSGIVMMTGATYVVYKLNAAA